MERRSFLEKAGKLSAVGALAATGISKATVKTATRPKATPTPSMAQLKPIQKALGYTDEQFRQFLKQPRNQKVISRLKDCNETYIEFKIVKVHGCLAGHKVGEKFVFPNGGNMDMKKSAEKLCPFLMPPMTRLVWIIQERIWEGLDPQPLFFAGQCDDVGYDCNGFGRVILEAKVKKMT